LDRLKGIDLYVHGMFFILLAWIGLSHRRSAGALGALF
jgi:hypothetical protein